MRKRQGQVVFEYLLVMLVAITGFMALFNYIRLGLFEIWVCEMGPRIQTPGGCTSRQECLDALAAMNALNPGQANSCQ